MIYEALFIKMVISITKPMKISPKKILCYSHYITQFTNFKS